MEKIELNQIIKWTGSRKLAGGNREFIGSISTDSRSVEAGDFFIPLKGPNFDGHKFIPEAIKKGATGFVIENSYAAGIDIDSYAHKIVVSVKDTLKFMQDLAYHYIRMINPVVIGITGSAGKTTTKDMLASILGESHDIGFTPKNYNNDIGVPKAILNLGKQTDFFIAEIAMRKKGQIKQLSRLIGPGIGIITSVGEAHLQFFESVEEIARTKAEIASELSGNKGVLFLNHDNPWTGLIKDICGCRTKEFGYNHDLDYNFKNESMDSGGCFGFDFCNRKNRLASVRLPIAGYHNIYNACAAAGVSHYLHTSVEDIQKGLAAAIIEKDRMQILKKGSITVIDDCYNANPLSVACALESLRQIADMKKARSVAVLAEMLELGPDSDKLHYKMGKKIAENNIDLLITFGKMARNINQGYGKDSYYFENKQDCLEAVRGLIKAGDVVLIKGSRANRMEDIIEKI